MNEHLQAVIAEIQEDFATQWQEGQDLLDWFRGALKRHLLVESEEEIEAIMQEVLAGLKRYRELRQRPPEAEPPPLAPAEAQELQEEIALLAEKLAAPEED